MVYVWHKDQEKGIRFACLDRREKKGERIPGKKKYIWFPCLNKVVGTV